MSQEMMRSESVNPFSQRIRYPCSIFDKSGRNPALPAVFKDKTKISHDQSIGKNLNLLITISEENNQLMNKINMKVVQ
jgi:hypothetical protein